MEEYIRHFELTSNKDLKESEIENFKTILSNTQGIINAKVDSKNISLNYYYHLTSIEKIKEILIRRGFELKPFKKQSLVMRFITKLGRSNKKALGNKKLDCCDLNEY